MVHGLGARTGLGMAKHSAVLPARMLPAADPLLMAFQLQLSATNLFPVSLPFYFVEGKGAVIEVERAPRVVRADR